MGRVFDCFTFKNEFLLLDLRLHELSDYVDFFVLVEGTRSFTNRPKRLYFLENRSRFQSFLDRIIHIIVDDFPPYRGNRWTYQHYQRNAIERGLQQAQADDLIMLSDVDEIPRPSSIAGFREPISFVENRHYLYKFNTRTCRAEPLISTHMVRKRHFRSTKRLRNHKLYPVWRIDRRPFWDPIYRHNPHVIADGGWHFSFLMSAEEVENKLKDYSSKRYLSVTAERIQTAMARNEHILSGRNQEMYIEPIDDSFPQYVQTRQEELAPWIAPWDDKALTLKTA